MLGTRPSNTTSISLYNNLMNGVLNCGCHRGINFITLITQQSVNLILLHKVWENIMKEINIVFKHSWSHLWLLDMGDSIIMFNLISNSQYNWLCIHWFYNHPNKEKAYFQIVQLYKFIIYNYVYTIFLLAVTN